MRVSLKFDGVSADGLRSILAECSRERENISPFHGWEPKVSCNGPELFGVEVAPINSVGAATRILKAADCG